jgi:hypothetical protein
MDSIVFHLDADNVGVNLAQSIKAYFGGKRVQVIVKPEETATEIVARNEQSHHDYALPYSDIARIADALDREEKIDVVAEIKKFMVTK